MVGIDLGTTHSLVAILTDGEPEVFTNELGEVLTPSAVAASEDGEILVGRAAKDRLVTAPEAGKAFFKRDMGTGSSYRFGGRRWSPVECSALVLRELKRIAEMRLGRIVDEAVITVPAYFHDPQRLATIEAAKIAGLKVRRLINEPTAAALAYGYQASDELSTLLVFDLGGGTFDVTLLEVFEGVVEVKASAGEGRLGGEDYTDSLAAWIAREFGWSPGSENANRWREQVESLKRALSRAESASVMLGEREARIDRDDFAEATRALTARLRPVVLRCLRDAQITPSHIDAVLLVGGASRMPLVHELLKDEAGQDPVCKLDPDTVVAAGAAVQAALCESNKAVKDIVLTDVCPHTLGVSVCRSLAPGHVEPGIFSPILERNTTVPASRSDTFSTLSPDQDEILIQVFQGESRFVKENHKIGQLRLTGLRHQPGQAQPGVVEVRFSYDMNGILEVEVTVLHNNKKMAQVFEQRPGQMTREEVAEAIARLSGVKMHPRSLMPNRARIERAMRLFTELRGEARKALGLLVDQFEAALSSQEEGRIRLHGERLDAFLKPHFEDE